jgi:hypothetical protein
VLGSIHAAHAVFHRIGNTLRQCIVNDIAHALLIFGWTMLMICMPPFMNMCWASR